jgi:SAM-dependent methyltransferase
MITAPAAAPSWASGYRTDIEYTHGFFGFLNPDHLILLSLLQGVRPPAPVTWAGPGSRALSYCELGSGQGVTLNSMAARDPEGRYFGIDYNPGQIRNARAFATAAGIGNATFLEESFDDLRQAALPEFDIIVCHGVWSWVAKKTREHMVEFIRRRLKPGGLVYMSYNCAVGRSAEEPLRQLLFRSAQAQAGAQLQQVKAALDLADAVAAEGAGYFAVNGAIKQRLKELRKHPLTYVLHEYMNRQWDPFYFHDVAADMAEAKCSFVSSIRLAQTRPSLALPRSAQPIYRQFTDLGARELLKDIWINQTFRQDLFVKGLSRLTVQEQLAGLKPLRFCLVKERGQCTLEVKVPGGLAKLPEKLHGRVLDSLAHGVKTASEIGALMGAASEAKLIDVLQVLWAVGYIGLAVEEKAEAAIAERLGRVEAAAFADLLAQPAKLAAVPKLGTLWTMATVDYALLGAHRLNAANVTQAALETLKAKGRQLMRDGKPVGAKGELALMTEAAAKFAKTQLPLLRSLGAV